MRCTGGDAGACEEGWSIGSQVEDLGTATTALFITAGTAACGALALFFFTDFGAEERPVVAVGAGPAQGSVGGAPTGWLVSAALAF